MGKRRATNQVTVAELGLKRPKPEENGNGQTSRGKTLIANNIEESRSKKVLSSPGFSTPAAKSKHSGEGTEENLRKKRY